MIIFAEGFDNIHPYYYASLPGFRCTTYYPGVTNPSLYPFTISTSKPMLLNKGISEGYALLLGSYFRPCVFESTKKLIFGFSLFTINYDYGVGQVGLNDVGMHTKGGTDSWKFRGAGSDSYVDVCFLNNPQNSDTLGVGFKCRLYFIDPFTVRARFITKNEIADGYPIISMSEDIPVDTFYRSNYYEVMVDAEGAQNSNGCAELRINGKTVYRRDNIVTSPYNDYGSDVANFLAGFSGVSLAPQKYWTSDNTGAYYGDRFFVDYMIDDLYVADASGGINDSFLGPVKIKGADNYNAAVTDFEAVDNGIVVDDPADLRMFLGNLAAVEFTRYLQAPTDDSRNENLYEFNVPVSSPVYAVLSRTVSTGNPNVSGSSGLIFNGYRAPEIDSSFSIIGVPGAIFPGVKTVCDSIINYNPANPAAWTFDSATEMLYGFKYKSGSVSDITSNLVESSRYMTTGLFPSILDGSTGTFITLAARTGDPSPYIDIQLPEDTFLEHLEFCMKIYGSVVFSPSNVLTDSRAFVLYTYQLLHGDLSVTLTKSYDYSLVGSVLSFKVAISSPAPVRRVRLYNRFYDGFYRATDLYYIKAFAIQGS